MIRQEVLTEIAKGVNSTPCPLCGKNHRVNLSLNANHSFAISSADWMILPSGGKIFIEIEDGACVGFRERLMRFLSKKFLLM